jgi:hypothetical protein
MTMEDVIIATKNRIKCWIDGYVDDTSLFTNLKFGESNIKKLIEIGQKDGQIWEQLLNTSGGELELSKCFYYLLSWKWTRDGNPIPQSILEQNIEQIKIQLTTTKEVIKLEQKEVHESHKTLGTYKCICGKENTQFQILMEKSSKLIEKAVKGQFKRKQAWLAYKCFYIPSMVYCLSAVNMEERQLIMIQKKQQHNLLECVVLK